MATFRRLEVWTDARCNAGTLVAAFEPDELVRAVLTESLTGQESLGLTVSRLHLGAEQLVHARVVRVVWSDTSFDTEWRIADITDQSGEGDAGQRAVECQPMALDLARAVFVEWGSDGAPVLAISGVQLTAEEWIETYVIPAIDESDLLPVSVGTIDYTNRFDLGGEFQTALQILRAILEPGRAAGEFQFRRNGNTDYQIDILTARGASADTVRVQTTRNLLANVRRRSLGLMGTKFIPRGSSDSITRTLGHHAWAVTVVSGTQADLTDPAGGAGPCAFTDQLVGLYVARQVATFSSQLVSASTTAGRITVASTAGWSTGDLVEFRTTSGSSGRRMVSLQHPTRALPPASGGYGEITRPLDVAAQGGDQNKVPNSWGRTWTTPSSPPDNWTTTGGTTSQETSILKFETPALKLDSPAGSSPGGAISSPTIKPFTTADLLHAAHVWVYPDMPDLVVTEATSGLTSITTTTNTVVAGAGSWLTTGLAVGDLFAISGHATAANNKKVGAITALTTLTLTTGAGLLTTNATPDTSFTITKLTPNPLVTFLVSDVATPSNWYGSVVAALPKNEWSLLALQALDLSAAASGVKCQVRVPLLADTDVTIIVPGFSLNEGADDIPDIERAGGNVLWQRANVALAALSNPIAGYDTRLADLSRLDAGAWDNEWPEIGGNVEIVDSDLGDTTTQRIVELQRDLLSPTATIVRLANDQQRASELLAG